jgi:phosphate-selective porin OprO/OprP
MSIVKNLILTSSIILLSTTTLYASKAMCPTQVNFANKIKKLEEQVQKLEAKHGKYISHIHKGDAKGHHSTHSTYVEHASSDAAASTTINPNDVKVTLEPGPRIATADGRYSASLSGYIQGDVGNFSKDIDTNDTVGKISNARLKVSGVIDTDFQYAIEGKFTPDSTILKTASLNYSGVPDFNFTAGLFGPNFAMEQSASSRNYTFIEPASISNIFPGKDNVGVQLSYNQQKFTLSTGIFAKSKIGDGASYLFRGTAAPINENGSLVHIGANVGLKTFSKTYGAFGYQESPGSGLAKTNKAPLVDFVTPNDYALNTLDTGNILNTKNALLLGAEFAFAHRQFSVQTEYMQSKVKTKNPAGVKDKHTFKSAYVQAAWTLTGEQREYDTKGGVFGGITPTNPFSLKTGGTGAWEIAARYNTLNLNGNGAVKGGKMHNYTVGLNWYLNKHVKLAADYTWSKVTTTELRTDGATKYNPNIALFRAQVSL